MIKIDSQTREKLQVSSAQIILLPTVLSEIDFMYSTKESEYKDAECIFRNGKFSENKHLEILIKIGNKIIRALAIILGIFVSFDC